MGINMKRWLNQSLTYRQRTASDPRNGDTFAAAATIRGRYEDGTFLTKNELGEEVVGTGRVFTLQTGKPGDRITDTGGRERSVIRWEGMRDVRGRLNHYEVIVQ